MLTLGYAEITSNFSPGSAGVNVTGLSITANIPANRDLEVTFKGVVGSTNGAGTKNIFILQDSSIVGGFTWNCQQSVDYVMTLPVRVPAPTAGSHTYAVRMDMGTAGYLTASVNSKATLSVKCA